MTGTIEQIFSNKTMPTVNSKILREEVAKVISENLDLKCNGRTVVSYVRLLSDEDYGFGESIYSFLTRCLGKIAYDWENAEKCSQGEEENSLWASLLEYYERAHEEEIVEVYKEYISEKYEETDKKYAARIYTAYMILKEYIPYFMVYLTLDQLEEEVDIPIIIYDLLLDGSDEFNMDGTIQDMIDVCKDFMQI